ncbi:MAG: HEAT repeat domain-containing protein, partial [Planctomyces sp.]
MESSDELTSEHSGSDENTTEEHFDEAAVIAVLRHGTVEARVDAADLLSDAETSEALSALMDGLKDPELAVRIACMESLGSARAVSAIPILLDAFHDADPRLRQAAASAFWRFGSNSPEPDVMVAIQEAVPFLTNALRDPDEHVRVDAAGALGCTR